ncbi:hypothetical protein F5876DRAFT_72783 [Lentinula aff. lateritia]|uniref:Uncharacterized protein n=1 Tax=Lentinula aff. lateritia TaxID=2804960 RepID=A0ACC1UBV8_9AGAR|nr:hypothetical protein F5876DRAFT_72783 [Lentinula aff. lateritia]
MQSQRRTWSSFFTAWDGVTWPVSLTAPPPSTAVGRGVGLNGAVLGKQTSQLTRNAPSLNQTLERTNINGENDHVSPYISPALQSCSEFIPGWSASSEPSTTTSARLKTTINALVVLNSEPDIRYEKFTKPIAFPATLQSPRKTFIDISRFGRPTGTVPAPLLLFIHDESLKPSSVDHTYLSLPFTYFYLAPIHPSPAISINQVMPFLC